MVSFTSPSWCAWVWHWVVENFQTLSNWFHFPPPGLKSYLKCKDLNFLIKQILLPVTETLNCRYFSKWNICCNFPSGAIQSDCCEVQNLCSVCSQKSKFISQMILRGGWEWKLKDKDRRVISLRNRGWGIKLSAAVFQRTAAIRGNTGVVGFCKKTLPEAQRTQGIASKTWVISPAK